MNTIIHCQYWNDHAAYYIMEENGNAMIRITQEGTNFELSDLYVAIPNRQKGMATELIQKAINFCKDKAENGIIQICTNYNSEIWVGEWYKKLGFKYAGMEAPMSIQDEQINWINIYKIKY